MTTEEYNKGFEDGYNMSLVVQTLSDISKSLEKINSQIINRYGERNETNFTKN